MLRLNDVEKCKKISDNNVTILNFGAIPDRKGDAHELVADLSVMTSLNWNIEYSLELGLGKVFGKNNF